MAGLWPVMIPVEVGPAQIGGSRTLVVVLDVLVAAAIGIRETLVRR